MAPAQSRGGTFRYLIEHGAWIRGGKAKDLEVVVTMEDEHNIARISVSHRSLTPDGVLVLSDIYRRHLKSQR